MDEVEALVDAQLLGAAEPHAAIQRSERAHLSATPSLRRSVSARAIRLTAGCAGRDSWPRPRARTGFEMPAAERDELLDLLMGAQSVRNWVAARSRSCIGYPASQAALARLDPDDPRCALRFELYCEGIELANGFHELARPPNNAPASSSDRRERRRRGLPAHGIDERLLGALEAGLPDCAGVALGFDRC